jgi:hypothetical protein
MTMQSSLRWRVRLNADPLHKHSFSVLSGLGALHAGGEIQLELVDRHLPPESAMWIEVVGLDGHRKAVCIDLADRGAIASPARAELADVVWKRSVGPGVEAQALGLTVHMRSGAEPLFRCAVGATKIAGVSGLRRTLNAIRSRPPLIELYERPQPKEGVVFQVRAWDPADGGDDEGRHVINEQRARLITALRSTFGPLSRGGFTPSPYAVRRYPHLISPLPTDQAAYARLIASSSIGVSTIGLGGSSPLKLGEYMAAGCAVVSERLHYPLPEDPGVALERFDDVDGCISACERLLDDGDALDRAQVAARCYWHDSVRPDVLLRNRLTSTVPPVAPGPCSPDH